MIIHKHHITPKCLLKHKDKKFIDDDRNIVELTFEQHAAAHKWLFMLTGEIGCERAWNMMEFGKWAGGPHSEETKKKMSKSHMGLTYKMSEQGKKNLSIAKSGRKHTAKEKEGNRIGRAKILKRNPNFFSDIGKKSDKTKISGANHYSARKYLLISPNGEEFNVNGNLGKFCKEHDFSSVIKAKIDKGVIEISRKRFDGSINPLNGWEIRSSS